MKKIIIIIETVFVFILISILLLNQEKENNNHFHGIRKNLLDTIEIIKNYPFIELKNPKTLNIESINQLNRALWLSKNASNYELYRLLDYPNGTVKAYSFYIIFYLHEDISILKNKQVFTNDTSKVLVSNNGFYDLITCGELINDIINLPPRPSVADTSVQLIQDTTIMKIKLKLN